MQVLRVAHLFDPALISSIKEVVIIGCVTIFVCSIITAFGRFCGCRCRRSR